MEEKNEMLEKEEILEGQCAMTERPISVITQEIKFFKEQASIAVIEIGKRLIEAKQGLSHGEWGIWLAGEVEFSERTAQNFMRIAKELNPQALALLGNSTSKAILLLTMPEAERGEFMEQKHEVEGEEKGLEEMTSREMERLIKELAEERKAKEALQVQLTCLEEQQENTKADAQQEEVEARAMEAEAKLTELREELAALKARPPVESAPEEGLLEQLRKEAEEAAIVSEGKKLAKKIEKAKKEAEDAKKELEERKSDEAKAAGLQEKALAEKEAETAELRKKLAMAGSSRVAIFKVHFENTQGEINRMMDCIQTIEKEGETEDGEKLKKALISLCQKTVEVLGNG